MLNSVTIIHRNTQTKRYENDKLNDKRYARLSVAIYPGGTSLRGMPSFSLETSGPVDLALAAQFLGSLRDPVIPGVVLSVHLRTIGFLYEASARVRASGHLSGGLQSRSLFASPDPWSGIHPLLTMAHRTVLAAVACPRPLVSCADLSRTSSFRLLTALSIGSSMISGIVPNVLRLRKSTCSLSR